MSRHDRSAGLLQNAEAALIFAIENYNNPALACRDETFTILAYPAESAICGYLASIALAGLVSGRYDFGRDNQSCVDQISAEIGGMVRLTLAAGW
jgi:hypothetical protein